VYSTECCHIHKDLRNKAWFSSSLLTMHFSQSDLLHLSDPWICSFRLLWLRRWHLFIVYLRVVSQLHRLSLWMLRKGKEVLIIFMVLSKYFSALTVESHLKSLWGWLASKLAQNLALWCHWWNFVCDSSVICDNNVNLFILFSDYSWLFSFPLAHIIECVPHNCDFSPCEKWNPFMSSQEAEYHSSFPMQMRELYICRYKCLAVVCIGSWYVVHLQLMWEFSYEGCGRKWLWHS
jgi:hypothetical protein